MCVCVGYVHMCGSGHGGLKRVLDPLDFESLVTVSCSAWVLEAELSFA